MTEFLQNLFNGVVSSGIYLLIALGVTAIFGLTRLINFAHGEVVIVGAFTASTLTERGISFWVGLLAAILISGILGWLLERGLFRFTLRSPLNGLVVGLGVLLIGEAIVQEVWGTSAKSVNLASAGLLHVGGVVFSKNSVIVLAVTIAMTALLLYLIRYTSVGNKTRAAQVDPLSAAHVGVNVGRIVSLTFVVGSALAGAAGAVLGTIFPIDPSRGGDLILIGFAIALLGGLGNVAGAIIASLAYGIGGELISAYWLPQWLPLYTYGLILVVIIIRPGGLFGGGSSTATAEQFAASSVSTSQRQRAPNSRPRWARASSPIVVLAIIVIVYTLQSDVSLRSFLALCGIYSVVAYSLNMLFDNVGMLSLAHGGFMAIGAYAAALLEVHEGLGFWAALVPAAVMSGVAALFVGYCVSRARGHYFLLLTFAFGSLVILLIENLSSLTNGDQGQVITESPGSIGPIHFTNSTSMFYLLVAFGFLAAGIVYFVRRSLLGARLASIRENEVLATSLGLGVHWYKAIAFGITGAMAGVGGVLYLYQQHAIVPDSFTVLVTIQFVIMVVLGGRGLAGPPIGAFVLVYVPEALKLGPIPTEVADGVVLIIVMLLLPRGVVPSVSQFMNWAWDRRKRGPGGLGVPPRDAQSLASSWLDVPVEGEQVGGSAP